MTDVLAPGHRAVTPGCVRLDRWWRLGGTAPWCRGSTADHILVGSPGPSLHRDHLALHGVGHMVFGHVGHPAVAQGLRGVLDGADLAALRERSTRVVYTPDEEWQAEVFATRVRQLAVVARPGPPAGAERVLANPATVLEHRPRRPRSTGEGDAT
ncbi:hypothetical protein EV384_3823 [Micromonospora kangleipakensis]|uniref:IrrE N-terminal-like domain-containing protein n=1 Tax=Micromonospora kangleipakensis TaxID=1077942 RepID=A0A4Q8BDA1_9ACTN|nr:hypothetical protein [Micromonospora kangleipakensis]RZU75291.1 hypothetical protein EV384_3823 [Micromonospora kangleipakensis]